MFEVKSTGNMFQKTTTIKKVRYKSNKRKDEFFRDLKGRVNNYFKQGGINKHYNSAMVVKTVIAFGAWLLVYSILISNQLSFSYAATIAGFCVLGFANIFIAFAVMHDACHNAYAGNKKVNRILGYSMNFIGGNSYLFTKMHNAHHAFVNIHGIDVTLESHGTFRFTPHEPYKWFHKYQHIYTPLLYMIASLHWVTVKDFKWFFVEESIGNKKNIKHPRFEFWMLIFSKSFYFGYAIILPILLLSVPFWVVLIGFLIMHIPSSLAFALLFQITHVYDGTHYPLPDDSGNIENNYALHVLETTSDFGRGKPWVAWLTGGINLHVVHHLFPTVCHIHYEPLTEIIRDCALEYGIQYYEQPSFWSAIKYHMKMLHHLSKPDAKVPQYGKSLIFN